jgi:hypothetical protein
VRPRPAPPPAADDPAPALDPAAARRGGVRGVDRGAAARWGRKYLRGYQSAWHWSIGLQPLMFLAHSAPPPLRGILQIPLGTALFWVLKMVLLKAG